MKKFLFLFLLFATLAHAQLPGPVYQGFTGRSYLDSLRILLGAGRKPIISLAIGSAGQILQSGGPGFLPSWVNVRNISIGDTVENSANYGPLVIDSAHHLAQLSLTGTTGKLIFSNGAGSPLTFENGYDHFVVLAPNVSATNIVQPTTTGVAPLTLKTATISTANAFTVLKYDSTDFFNIDASGGANFYKNIGLWNGSSLDYGTAGQVATSQGPGLPAKWADPSGGLINWIDSVNTSAPNATIPVVALVAKNSATDVDAVIQAKGAGAFAVQIADNTATGGNKRGQNAFDGQSSRASASQVASGLYSVIGGGTSNQASANFTTVGGGSGNAVTSSYSTISGGTGNTISIGYANIAGGTDNTISGGGQFGTIGGGQDNTVTGLNSTIVGGKELTLSAAYDFGFLGRGNFTSIAGAMEIGTNNIATFGDVDLWLMNNDTAARSLYFFAPNTIIGSVDTSNVKWTAFHAGVQTTSVNYRLPLADATVGGQVLSSDAAGNLSWVSGGTIPGSGTVTSVALTMPSIFSVSGSPVTTSGTLAASLNSQSQNLFLASPNGSSGTPSFRAIVTADLPTGASGLAYSTITADQNIAAWNAYINNKSGSQLVITLPTTGTVGAAFQIVGLDSHGWKIAQNASQLIHFGSATSTTGVTGYVSSNDTYDVVTVVCTVTDNEWTIISSVGTITVN